MTSCLDRPLHATSRGMTWRSWGRNRHTNQQIPPSAVVASGEAEQWIPSLREIPWNVLHGKSWYGGLLDAWTPVLNLEGSSTFMDPDWWAEPHHPNETSLFESLHRRHRESVIIRCHPLVATKKRRKSIDRFLFQRFVDRECGADDVPSESAGVPAKSDVGDIWSLLMSST